MRDTIHRLPFLQQWQPHPAAPDTHTTPLLILQSVHEEISRLTWQGNAMRMARPDLCDRLTTFLMSLTVLTQAEIDKYFLLLYYTGRQLSGIQDAAPLLMLDTQSRRCTRELVPWLDALPMLWEVVSQQACSTGNLERPLCWHHGKTYWTLPLKLFRERTIGNRHILEIVQWARVPFHLSVIGNIGSVPRRHCGTPLGIKVPIELHCLLPELRLGRNFVEEAFASRLFDGTRRHREELQPWLGNHICAFRIYRWILLWHPEATSPFQPAPPAFPQLWAVNRQSYLYFKPPVRLFSAETRSTWGIRDDMMLEQVHFAANETEEQRFADMRSWVRNAIAVDFYMAALNLTW